MTDREAIELMAFFFVVAVACQVWLWLDARNATKNDGSASHSQPRPRRISQ